MAYGKPPARGKSSPASKTPPRGKPMSGAKAMPGDMETEPTTAAGMRADSGIDDSTLAAAQPVARRNAAAIPAKA